MSEQTRGYLSWVFVGLIAVSAATLFTLGAPVGASEDHDEVRALRHGGDILPLAELLGRPELSGMRVLEAELERKQGRLVYELELLDAEGRVHERLFDAATGQPLYGKAGH